MDLNKLRTFTVVAEIGNITKAAKKLYRTQPAISNQLKDLEEDTKLSLFERKNSRIYLTKEGQQLYEFAKQRILELDDMVTSLHNNCDNIEGVVRLGVQREICQYLVPNIVSDFRVLYPNVQFQIKLHDNNRLEESLLNNEVDTALTITYKQRDFFEITPYITFERDMIASPAYLKKFPAINRFEDILNLEYIGFNSRLPDFKYWLKKNGKDDMCSEIEKMATSVIVKDLDTIHELIRKDIGIALCDRIILKDDLESGKLVRLIPYSVPMYLTVDISRRKVRTPNLLQDIFFDFLKKDAQYYC